MDHSKEKEEENYSTQREMEVEEELLVTGEKQDGVVARAGVAGASDNNGGCGATTDGLGSGTLGLKPSLLSSSRSSAVISRSSISSASRMSSNRLQIQSTSSEVRTTILDQYIYLSRTDRVLVVLSPLLTLIPSFLPHPPIIGGRERGRA